MQLPPDNANRSKPLGLTNSNISNTNKNTDSSEAQHDEVLHLLLDESPLDRIKQIFQNRPNSAYKSEEMVLIEASTTVVATLSGLVFFSAGAYEAKMDFIRESQHVKFLTKFRAHRAMRDKSITGGLALAGKYSLKLGLFTFFFTSSLQLLNAYRNKDSIFHYMTAGSVTGALLRFNMGPKGMFASSIISGFLGSAVGLIMVPTLKYFEEDYYQRHYRTIKDKIEFSKSCALLTKES